MSTSNYNPVLYGIGLGPGDPELITVKALNKIKECTTLFVPGKDPETSVAYGILRKLLSPEELQDKEIIHVVIPMKSPSINIEDVYNHISSMIIHHMDNHKTCAFLTLGDPTLYSTFSPIKALIETAGYNTVIINGVPSFVAVAATCNRILTYGNQLLHILPHSDTIVEFETKTDTDTNTNTDTNTDTETNTNTDVITDTNTGTNTTIDTSASLNTNNRINSNTRFGHTTVYMKSGTRIESLLEDYRIKSSSRKMNIYGCSNCGFDDQVIYQSIKQLDNTPPQEYFTTLIVEN